LTKTHCVALLVAMMLVGSMSSFAQAAQTQETTPFAEDTPTQTAPSHSTQYLGLGLAVGYYQVRDHTLPNPHLHQAPIIGLAVDYELESGPARYSVHFGGGYSRLADAYNLSAMGAVARLRLEAITLMDHYGQRKQWALYAGAFLRDYVDLAMYPFIDDGHIYWINAIGFGPTVSLEKEVWDNARARLQFRAPVVAMVSRPPADRFYNNDKDKAGYISDKLFENMELRTIDEHLSLEGEASVRMALAGGYFQTLGYRLYYTSDSSPAQTHILSHTIFLRLGGQW